tara:strand:- start:1000 stop:1530 length:531 start_codon:yes stop_codon:yes gene_type:complete
MALSAYITGAKTINGIAKIYLIDKAVREASEVTYSVSAGAITIANAGADVDCYLIKPRLNTISFTQPEESDNTANTYKYTQTLEFPLQAYNAALIDMNQEMSKKNFEFLICRVDGTYVLAGTEQNGMQSNGGDGGTFGVAALDQEGSTRTFVCQSSILAPIVTYSEFTAAFNLIEA